MTEHHSVKQADALPSEPQGKPDWTSDNSKIPLLCQVVESFSLNHLELVDWPMIQWNQWFQSFAFILITRSIHIKLWNSRTSGNNCGWKPSRSWPSVAVQWLRVCICSVAGMGLIPGWGTRIPPDKEPKKKMWSVLSELHCEKAQGATGEEELRGWVRTSMGVTLKHFCFLSVFA